MTVSSALDRSLFLEVTDGYTSLEWASSHSSCPGKGRFMPYEFLGAIIGWNMGIAPGVLGAETDESVELLEIIVIFFEYVLAKFYSSFYFNYVALK